MTAAEPRCAVGAAAEQLAGTAPLARWWWLIEVPGSWGRKAVADCRISAVRDLASDDQRRVLLIRRPGRHPARDERAPLRVWIAGAMPDDPSIRLSVAEDHDEILDWPIEGPSTASAAPDAPVLAVCTNSSRDLCCGIDGRALVSGLAGQPGVWECSHLGGHRFAPTALHVPTGLVYGRLDVDTAQVLCARGPGPETASHLRGRSALAPPAQVAEVEWLRRGQRVDPFDARITHSGDEAIVVFADLPAMHLRRVSGPERAESCGGTPGVAMSWQVAQHD